MIEPKFEVGLKGNLVLIPIVEHLNAENLISLMSRTQIRKKLNIRKKLTYILKPFA